LPESARRKAPLARAALAASGSREDGDLQA